MKILRILIALALSAACTAVAQVPRVTDTQRITNKQTFTPITDPVSPGAGDFWLSATTPDMFKYRSGGTTYSLLTVTGAAAAFQPLDSDLTAIAALSTTSYGRSLLAAIDAAAARTLLGSVIGTNVQAYDADLDDLADGSLTGSKVGTGISATNVTTGTLPAAQLPAFTGGDVTSSAGSAVLTIGANSVALGTDTTGNYVATIADSGASEITVSGSGSESAAVTLAIASTIARDSEVTAAVAAAVSDTAYNATSWDGVTTIAPSKNAVRDQIELLQPLDSDLTAIAALTTTSFGRGLLDDADAAAGRTSLGVVIGTNVQAYDADLDDLADGSLTGSKVGTGISATNVTTGTLPAAQLPAFTGGDVTSSAGSAVLTIGANSVALGTDTTGNYVATIADSGAGEVTVTGSGSETAAVTLAIASSIARDSEVTAAVAAAVSDTAYNATSWDGVTTIAPSKNAVRDQIELLQPLDSDLTAIAALTTTSFGRGLLDDADAAAGRTSLGVVIGTNVQAYDADLDDLADGSLTGSKVGTGISAANVTTGTLPTAQLPAFSGGDVTSSAGSAVLTIGADSVALATDTTGNYIATIADAGSSRITVSGSGSENAAVTLDITNDAVSFAKMQNIATDRLVGRDTASSGDPEEISVGGGLEFTGSSGIQRSALTGDVTASAGSNSTTLANIPSGTTMAGSLLATNIAAPSTPAAGKTSIYIDSTSKNIAAKNDAGTVNHGVQTVAAADNTFISGIADSGAVTTGSAGTMVLDFSYSTAPSGASGGSGSWSYVLPATARFIRFAIVQCPGGGGGAGGRFASGVNGRGGGAGGSGVRIQSNQEILVSELPSTTLTLTIGQGGTGASGQTANDTGGANGGNGGAMSIVCGGATIFNAPSSSAGQGGIGGANTSLGTGGAAGAISATATGGLGAFNQVGTVGGAGGTTGAGSAGSTATVADSTAVSFAGGGPLAASGGGGALPTTPSNQAGGAGGGVRIATLSTTITGPSGVAGAAGAGSTMSFGYSTGAAGGSSNASGAGYAGGTGAYGIGGGGGGASLNGSVSGAGGNGGDGFVRIIVTF